MDLVVPVLITVLIVSAVVGRIVGGYIWLKRSAMTAQERAFRGLAIFSEPKPELVAVSSILITDFSCISYKQSIGSGPALERRESPCGDCTDLI